jgi:hypothetical protein
MHRTYGFEWTFTASFAYTKADVQTIIEPSDYDSDSNSMYAY